MQKVANIRAAKLNGFPGWWVTHCRLGYAQWNAQVVGKCVFTLWEMMNHQNLRIISHSEMMISCRLTCGNGK
jgi:hypothetical protein